MHRSTFFITAFALVALLLAGCQTATSEDTAEVVIEVEQIDIHVSGRTLSSGMGAPLSGNYEAPSSIQDLLNRYDVAFIGTISTVGSPVEEKPDDWNPEVDAHLQSRGIPPLRVRITYYEMTFEEVFLDDGLVRNNPRLRLSGDHSDIGLQAGERYFIALQTVSDGRGYGINADWNLIHLDGGAIRNFDGKEPRYAGGTNEETLRSATKTAVSSRVHLPMSDWPMQEKWRD